MAQGEHAATATVNLRSAESNEADRAFIEALKKMDAGTRRSTIERLRRRLASIESGGGGGISAN